MTTKSRSHLFCGRLFVTLFCASRAPFQPFLFAAASAVPFALEAVSRFARCGRFSFAEYDVGQKLGLERRELRFAACRRAVFGAAGRLGSRGVGGRARGVFADVDFVGESRLAAFLAGFAAASGGAARAALADFTPACAAACRGGGRGCC